MTRKLYPISYTIRHCYRGWDTPNDNNTGKYYFLVPISFTDNINNSSDIFYKYEIPLRWPTGLSVQVHYCFLYITLS